MKKNLLYIVLFIVCFGAAGFAILKNNNKKAEEAAATYTLLDRKGPLTQAKEWPDTKKHAAALEKAVSNNPYDTKSLIALANLFILEARATGNYAYYDKAAMKLVSDVLSRNANDFEALTLKALLLLSQHHFYEGLAVAEKARFINPYNAFVYGMLVDGNVEMGNYDSAVANADRMMSIRPDIRSYARASYLREIYGDLPGAIEAMKMAVTAGYPGDESTEWSRTQLGHLYEQTGDLKNALMNYTVALENRDAYPPALAGMARLALADKNYNAAADYYKQADSLVTDVTYKDALADVYLLSGDKEKAAAMMKIVIDSMNSHAKVTDESIPHHADKELAYAYLKVSKYDKALEHATAEYKRRPNNIDVNETMGWVYYKKNDAKTALPYMTAALKTGNTNPTLLCHAGLVYVAAGDAAKGKAMIQAALKNNPNISEDLKMAAMQAM